MLVIENANGMGNKKLRGVYIKFSIGYYYISEKNFWMTGSLIHFSTITQKRCNKFTKL